MFWKRLHSLGRSKGLLVVTYLDSAGQAQQAQNGGNAEVEDEGFADARGQLLVEVCYAEQEGCIVNEHKGAESQSDLAVSGSKRVSPVGAAVSATPGECDTYRRPESL